MRVGILGGTFDPVHRGHQFIAEEVLGRFELDRVLFMVAHLPPHKKKRAIVSSQHRFAMVVLATASHPKLFASDWELQRLGPSYTEETMAQLTARDPQNQYCFIAGGDLLLELHTWKRYARLLREHCLVFVSRPSLEIGRGSLPLGRLQQRIRNIRNNEKPLLQAGHSYLLESNSPAISSTKIRQTLAQGLIPSPGQLHENVVQYIRKYHLYD